MKNFIYLFISLILSNLLALACFHDDQLQKLKDYNESGGDGLPLYIKVLGVTPAAVGVDVSVNANISVQFDDNIEMTTVNDSTFSVNGVGAVSGTFSYNNQTKTVIFDPASALGYGNTYTVAVTKGVANSAGETLAADYSWSFTTVAVPMPKIDVYTPLGIPLVMLNSGGTWDYGSVNIIADKPAVFTIGNSGSSNLAITSYIISGADAGQFSITGSPVSPLNFGSTTGITVKFSPSVAGLKNAVLTIDSDDPNDPAFIINLTGRGLASGEPEIRILFNGTDLVSGSGNVNFGTTPKGSSKDITLVMSNIGSAALNIDNIIITGENTNKFSTDFLPVPGTILPNGEKTFQITFTPGYDNGMKKAEIRFFNNDSDESPFKILVRGRGN